MQKMLSVLLCCFVMLAGCGILSSCTVGPKYSRPKTAMDSRNEGTGKLYGCGVYVSRHLNLRLYMKASIQKMT